MGQGQLENGAISATRLLTTSPAATYWDRNPFSAGGRSVAGRSSGMRERSMSAARWAGALSA